MKSNLFSKWDAARDEIFIKDIKAFAEISDEIISDLPELVFEASQHVTAKRARVFLGLAAVRLGLDLRILNHAVDIGQFFLTKYVPGDDAESDEPSDLVADLIMLGLLPEAKRKVAELFLVKLRDLAKTKYEIPAKENRYTAAVLPTLSGIDTVADIRGMIRKEFTSEIDIEDYSPECIGVVPMGLVRLDFRKSPVETLNFQLDRPTLQLLIDHLFALQKELDSTCRFLNLDRDGSEA